MSGFHNLTWMQNSFGYFRGRRSYISRNRRRFSICLQQVEIQRQEIRIQLLLLIQMFPAILALSALYVIMERVYTFAPGLGLGTQRAWFLFIWVALWAWISGFWRDLSIQFRLNLMKQQNWWCNPNADYWLIFIPLAAPVLAVVALLSFIGTFNEFILARLFLVDVENRTVAVGTPTVHRWPILWKLGTFRCWLNNCFYSQ